MQCISDTNALQTSLHPPANFSARSIVHADTVAYI